MINDTIINHVVIGKHYNEHPAHSAPFTRLRVSTKEAAVIASVPIHILKVNDKQILLLLFKWVKIDSLHLSDNGEIIIYALNNTWGCHGQCGSF